ncbi:peptidyl-tRNA hydrolase [Labilibaculum antarcticum]|nr:peptidyl-tRNA hydrolase [Labilibaculum antarcticum]
MRKIIKISIILLTFMNVSNVAFAKSEKCNIDKLLVIHDNIDSLSFQMVEDFLYTFDEACKNNVEYSQWSNELLYKVIDKRTKLYFKVLQSENITNDSCILKSFRAPLLDYNYQKLYDKIKGIKTSESARNSYLNALSEIAKEESFELVR